MRIALALQTLLFAAGLTLAADVYAHKRTEAVGGVNLWGYRGPVARQRQPGEIRIVFVGGSRLYGWGATASETIPATVRWLIMLRIDVPGAPLRPVMPINLGELHADASTYAVRLERFAYLAPDYVVIHDDLRLDDRQRNGSRLYSATGYMPALPTVLSEKGMTLRYGAVAAGYGAAERVPQPAWRTATGVVLQAAGRALGAIDSAAVPDHSEYLASMQQSIAAARRVAPRVVVAAGPARTAEQHANLSALAAYTATLPRGEVAFVDLTSAAGRDEELATLDGYNYNGAGRVRVAEAIAPVLLEWIERSAPATHP